MRIRRLAALAASVLWMASAALAQEPASTPPAASAPAADAPPAKHHLSGCPSNIADFDNSDATRPLVERCLGRPGSVTRGHGDDVIYHYEARGGTFIIVFIFDGSGALTHFAAFKHEQ